MNSLLIYNIGPALVLILLAGNAAAQTITVPERQSNDKIVSNAEVLSNAEVVARIVFSNEVARAEYRRLHRTTAEQEALSNLVRHLENTPPKPWPAEKDKQEILRRSAVIMLSALGTNQVQATLSSHADQSAALSQAMQAALSYFKEVASILTTEDVETYIGYDGRSHRGQYSNSKHCYYMSFWTDTGIVKSVDKRPISDTTRVLERADFNKNGKLRAYKLCSPDSSGNVRTEVCLLFDDHGELLSHSVRSGVAKP